MKKHGFEVSEIIATQVEKNIEAKPLMLTECPAEADGKKHHKAKGCCSAILCRSDSELSQCSTDADTPRSVPVQTLWEMRRNMGVIWQFPALSWFAHNTTSLIYIPSQRILPFG